MKDFIEELHFILYELNNSTRKSSDEFHMLYGWNDNDSRIYFFNAVSEVCFLHGLTLKFIDNEIFQNKNQWREKQDYFDLNNEILFDRIVIHYAELVRNNFFIDILILVEHTLRIFGRNIYPPIVYEKIVTVKDLIIKQLSLDLEYKKLFDIIFKLRNTIHNGGLNSYDKPSITFNRKTFDFVEQEGTQTSLGNINFLFKEIMIFMKELFNHQESKKVNNMEHPYKPLFN